MYSFSYFCSLSPEVFQLVEMVRESPDEIWKEKRISGGFFLLELDIKGNENQKKYQFVCDMIVETEFLEW